MHPLTPSPFEHPEFDGHEEVVFCHDRAAGLKAIVAIHDTRLGPALGGCRMWPYPDGGEALTDVLRLARGMTYKNALAGLSLGGGKAVILADPRLPRPPGLLEAFGEAVERLGGRYVTAEDVGLSVADLDVVATRTRHARGTSARGLGDPSPYTARGVVAGMRAALAHRHGSDDLSARRVAVAGVGHVGRGVAELLHAAGARLVLADVRADAAIALADRLGAEVAGPASIHEVEADVYSPCALGGVLSKETIPALGAPVVAGAANNQLATPADGDRLLARGILYAPDYVINAGGVISIAVGDEEGEAAALARIDAIGATLREIFARADADGASTDRIAARMAEERLSAARPRPASA